MRLYPERCLRLPTRRSTIKSILLAGITQMPHRYYSKSANTYTSTITLPKTDYQLWPKHDLIRSQFLTKCVDECYQWQVTFPQVFCFWCQSENLIGDPLVLHDGPPYANGDLHLGEPLVNQLIHNRTRAQQNTKRYHLALSYTSKA